MSIVVVTSNDAVVWSHPSWWE